MSKKSSFIEFARMAIEAYPHEMNEEAKAYWEAFQIEEKTKANSLSDNAKIVLKFLQDNNDRANWKSKAIAEETGLSSRSVSGVMRGLASRNYVEKLGKDPIIYNITELGLNKNIEEE